MKLQTRHGLTYVRTKGQLWFDGQIIDVEDEDDIIEYRLAGFTPVDDEGQPLDLPLVELRLVEPLVVGLENEDGLFDVDSLNEDVSVSRVMTTRTPRRAAK